MSEPYIGEIRLVPYIRGAPNGWLACDGSLQSIAAYPGLYNLLGTVYGGDGTTDFALPDLRGRVPQHVGASSTATGGAQRTLGEQGGQETVRVTTAQLPAHGHRVAVASGRTSRRPAGAVRAPGGVYGEPRNAGAQSQPAGLDQSHDNLPPSLALLFIIAHTGIYPPQA